MAIGPWNRDAVGLSRVLLTRSWNSGSLLSIHASAGIGKTHLLHSIGHVSVEDDPSRRVVVGLLEYFGNVLQEAEQEDRLESTWQAYFGQASALLVDDVDSTFLSPENRSRGWSVIRWFLEEGRPVVVTSAHPLRLQPRTREQLAGLNASWCESCLNPPSIEGLCEIASIVARRINHSITTQRIRRIAVEADGSPRRAVGLVYRDRGEAV